MFKTVVHFKYGGSYVESEDGYRWNSKEPRVYSITFKTQSTEEITYSVLEDMIFKKMGIHRRTTQLKMSHLPLALGDKFPSYILDDDDVDSYLSSKEETRSFLHVKVSIVEVDSSFGLNYEGMESDARANNAITIYKEKGQEESLGEGGVGEDESIRSGNVDVDVDGDEDEGADWDSEDEDEYDSEDEDEDEYGSEDEDVDHGIGMEMVEVPFDGNENQYAREWDDDGTGLKLNQEFVTKFEAQDILIRASHEKSYDFKICNSDTGRYVVKCRGLGCTWYVRVVRVGNKWKVVTYRHIHTCSRAESSTTTNKRKGSTKLVAEYLKRTCPSLMDLPSPRSIMASVKKDIGVDVSYWTALRGKRAAEDCVRGNPVESYKILHSYLFMLEKANPGSVTRCVLDVKRRFKYLFVALGACIEGFRAMRKVLQVDATFLKTGRGGVLVFATAQDPNHHHYPIAFAVLDGENDASWNWFFSQMRSIIQDDPKLVWISDRNTSLIKGIRELYPTAQHGFCMYHLSQNVKGQVGTLRKKPCAEKFRALATIYTEVEFLREYEEFRKLYPKGVEYLETSVVEGPKKWARCYFPGERYNINTTNSAESLNNVFKDARKHSLLLMMDKIIEKMAEWFNRYRKESAADKSGASARKLVPVVENELSTRCSVAKRLHVDELNSFLLEYSVIGKDGKSYLVNLRKKSCSCRCFDIDEYPCVHGIAALFKYMSWKERPADIHIHELCSKYYQMDTWALAYFRTIYPVPHQSEWSGIPKNIQESWVSPPQYKKRKGRNQVKRIPSTGEKRRKPSNRSVPDQNLANLLGINNMAGSSADASQV